MLTRVPVTFGEASTFIRTYHRHHLPARGWKYGVGAGDGVRLVGVIVVGRPVSRVLDDGVTLEVTRCCVVEGARNAASFLYGTAWRVARLLGYRRLVTYTLLIESGSSLRSAGWSQAAVTDGGGWSCASRPRLDQGPLGPKVRWEVRC